MNILIDFLPFQHPNGAGGVLSFAKAVYDKLIERASLESCIYALYDSTKIIGIQYNYCEYALKNDITLIDIKNRKIAEIVEKYAIDVFFIAVGQFYAGYDVVGITCKTIMFIHDIFDIERCDNKIDLCLHDAQNEGIIKWSKRIINVISGRYGRLTRKRYNNIKPVYSSPKTLLYTVSEYSANALRYYFPDIDKDIHVCYSPLRTVTDTLDIQNEILKETIQSGKKYFFMVAANRIYKNPENVMKAFRRLWNEGCDTFLVTLKYGKTICNKHIDIDFLSDSDMTHAYKHAQALIFSSFFEGFGYPPIEALEQGTLTIASNVTSIPEILGEAGIYFSPYYPSDIFKAIKTVITGNGIDKEKMEKQFEKIRSRQQMDLDNLINSILNINDN